MMEYIEISAKTLNEAITKACIELSVSSDNLEYKVISEGSHGFLGFGSKPAVIKARKMMEKEPEVVIEPIVKEKKAEKVEVKAAPAKKEEKKVDKKPEKKMEKKPVVKEKKVQESAPVVEEKKERVVAPKTEEEIKAIEAAAREFLAGVFEAMNIEVVITMKYDQTEGSLEVDFEGPEMGLLIGKRGQTLDSLQYLTSLVVNKGQADYIRVKLDTENYRKRRKDTLENLAKNIAFKVKKTRKPVALEPMNPYERRIIHSALQNNKFVKTTSEGEEPYRHVVVMLKK